MSESINRRIVYVQYTNPAGYPPLEHSSGVLADAGWQVLFLGITTPGAAIEFEPHPNIRVRRLAHCAAGIRQKLHYLFFLLWCYWHARRFGPSWVYASDTFSTPAALLLAKCCGVRVVYHEHDAPAPTPQGWPLRQLYRCRSAVARSAEVIVIPSTGRAKYFAAEHGIDPGRITCVWNCPARKEAVLTAPEKDSGDFWLIYHGSIVPDRVPLTLLEAMARLPSFVKFRLIGYETGGSIGYVDSLRQRAISLGIESRFAYFGAMDRFSMLELGRKSHVGLAFMPLHTQDINMQFMVGASNKPYEYLACGCALLTSDLPDWNEAFVAPGLARSCNPEDPASIAAALHWYVTHRNALLAAGENGREMILSQWNYEAQFRPVQQVLENPALLATKGTLP
jgi:glycosyltransferase involved in cell wall biosynthesis